jgi:HTH-type transcriptional regulator/antitoxin HigA
MKKSRVATDYAVPTSEFILEWLDESGRTQAELARRMGVSAKHISKLISGAPLTPDVATKLELVTGIAARIWLGYEATYRADAARLSMTEEMNAAKDLAAAFPLSHLRAKGRMESTLRQPGRAVMELLAFFGVASVEALERCVDRQAVAFRQGLAHKVDDYALATWLRLVELEAHASGGVVAAFDEAALRSAIPQLRAISASPSSDFGMRLTEILGAAGVQLIYVEEVKGARVYGATRWTDGTPLIALTVRGRKDGQFWFTLFHEIGHVLLHKDGQTHIRAVDNEAGVDAAEVEANIFASEVLIPAKYETDLGNLKTRSDVRRFATKVGVSPGVIVGRLWHDQLWAYTAGHDLCVNLSITDED